MKTLLLQTHEKSWKPPRRTARCSTEGTGTSRHVPSTRKKAFIIQPFMRTRIEQEYKYSLSMLSLVNVLSCSCTGHSAPTSPDPYSDKSFDLPEVDTVEQEEIVSEKKDSGILDIIGTVLPLSLNTFDRSASQRMLGIKYS